MLEEHLHAVDHEDAALSAHTYFVAIEQFELSCALIMFILNADASFPFLYFSCLRPDPDVHRFWAIEH